MTMKRLSAVLLVSSLLWGCSSTGISSEKLPLWRKDQPPSPSWSETIGSREQGITANYYLSIERIFADSSTVDSTYEDLDRFDVYFSPHAHYSFKVKFKKNRHDPWPSFYVHRVQYMLDGNMSIDIEIHPAIGRADVKTPYGSFSHGLFLPYAPDTVRVQARLTNGMTMKGGVRIAQESKPKEPFDARRDTSVAKGDLHYFRGSVGPSSRDLAVIVFENHKPFWYIQRYRIFCISSPESGPFTHAELRLSPDEVDPRQEPVYARVRYSVPVYSMSLDFFVQRPWVLHDKNAKTRRTAMFECTTTNKKVIRTTREVQILPPPRGSEFNPR